MSYELTDFRKDIVEASKTTPVVVDFWAEWCGPCKTLGPVLEKLAGQARGKWKLVKIDVDKHQQIAAQFQIRSIPSVKMVYQGALVAEFNGALPEAQIKEWLKENLPESEDTDDETDVQELIKNALSEGNRDRAKEIVRAAWNNGENDADHAVLLAMLELPEDPETAKKLLNTLKEEDKVRFEIEQTVPETLVHVRKVADGNHSVSETGKAAELYVEGCNAFKTGDYRQAADSWINSIMLDRKVDDDGARKACVALFKILGDHHPVSQEFRRRFSMALY